MKRNIFPRTLCTVLSVAVMSSAFIVAGSSLSTSAVESVQSVQETTVQDPNTIESDFVATVGTHLMLAATASPTANASGYVNSDYVNLRKGAGTSYAVVTCMKKNTKFTYVDGKLYKNNWYKIKLSTGKTGYIHKNYASLSKTSSSNNNTIASSGYINDDYVNLRKGAGTDYAVVTCMRKNTAFTLVSTKLYNTNWYKIKLSNGKTGYVHKNYVKITSTSSSNSNSSNNTGSTTATTKTGYISSDYVNLRKGAGTNYSVVTCMRKNTKFTLANTKLYNTNWYYIKLSNGTKGYVHKNYIKFDTTSAENNTSDNDNTSTATVTGYVNDDYVNMRKGAGTNYSVVTCLRKNTAFTFVNTKLYNNSWYYIKLSNGTTGYIYYTYATMNKADDSDNKTDNDNNSDDVITSTGKLTLSDTSETIYVGNQYALTAVGANSVKWSSTDTSVATVDSNGIVTAKKSGNTTVKATSGSQTVTCKITVKTGNSVNISHTSISDISSGESILLKSFTKGVSWKSSNTDIAEVNSGIVDTKAKGYVTITAYTSAGASSCLIKVGESDSIRFTYASPNSAPKNSTVTFKAITDNSKTAVRFVVSNGTNSYTINATNKEADGDNYIWTGTKKLTASGKWSIKAYSKSKSSTSYTTTSGNGEGEVFVTASTDKTTTVCAERRASDEVINLIANYEGFLTAVTPDNITSDPTLGYGKVVTSGEQFYNNLTKSEAYAYLCQTVNKGGYTSRTNSFLLNNGVKFNQQQFDALVCFAYNVGASAIYNDSDLQSVLLNTGSDGTGLKAGASGYVNGSSVNLRSGAGTEYSVLCCMSKNTAFTFVDDKIYNSNWYKIKLSDGTTGYIYKSYASVASNSRDLKNVDKQDFLNNFLQYHHAAGSCYWGLLYRRIDEAEVFFHGDYSRDGQYNKKGFDFTCRVNSTITIK